MKKLKSEYDRIRHVARKLFSPVWVRRYGGGSEAEATKRLAYRFGFVGQETYMRSLCNLLGDYADQAGFERAVREMVTDGKRRMVERLQDCEAEVEDALKSVTTPDTMLVGDCYRQAFYFLRDHAPSDSKLVHGRVADGVGVACITHAWLKLPGEVVFDGVTQRFYREAAYYDRRGAVADQTFTGFEAMMMMAQHHHFGPWDD